MTAVDISWKDIIAKVVDTGDFWVIILLVIIIMSFQYVIRPSMDLFRETVTFYNNKCLELITKLDMQVNELSRRIDCLIEEIRNARMG